jgi:hypothetical protein
MSAHVWHSFPSGTDYLDRWDIHGYSIWQEAP